MQNINTAARGREILLTFIPERIYNLYMNRISERVAKVSEQKRILISMPSSLLSEIDEAAARDNVSRSEFVRLALGVYLKEKKRSLILKMMEKGYTDMGDINSEIAESGLAADNEALIIYEEILSECKQ